jgi:hypothetical protein
VASVASKHRALPRKRIRLWGLCSVWLLCAVLAWQRGVVGDAIRKHGAAHVLPVDLGDGFTITRVAVEDRALAPVRGACLSFSPDLFRDVLRNVSPWFAFLPPGVIREDVVLHGVWLPEGAPPELALPLMISCNRKARRSPWFSFRFHVDDLNALLRVEMADDWHESEEYLFGHYDLNQRIWFRTLSIQSENAYRKHPNTPVKLYVHATGRMRYNVEDGIIDATITPDVKALDGLVQLTPVYHDDGIGFDYLSSIDSFKIAVDNMAPWLERKIAAELKSSMERSLNKRRKRERYSKIRMPLWVPLNVVVDIEISESL